MFFTLFLGLLSIYLYDHIQKQDSADSIISKIFGIVIVLLISYVAELLHTDYGYWGVLLVFIFYLFKSNKLLMTISFFALCILKYIVSYINSGFNLIFVVLALFTFLPIIFINSYNGKQGPKVKYLLYVFYPVHLLILALLYYII